MLCTKDNFIAYSMAHTAFTCQVNTREKEIYKYIFSLIYNSVQIHPKSKCCAPACLCCTCFFLQRNSNQNFFYFHHMMPKFSCYSFMSARTLAKILNYLRGKYLVSSFWQKTHSFFCFSALHCFSNLAAGTHPAPACSLSIPTFEVFCFQYIFYSY